jgi:hypothetical protein
MEWPCNLLAREAVRPLSEGLFAHGAWFSKVDTLGPGPSEQEMCLGWIAYLQPLRNNKDTLIRVETIISCDLSADLTPYEGRPVRT